MENIEQTQNENNNEYEESDSSETSSGHSSITSSKSREYNRLESYPWKWEHSISKRDLAKNGFFYDSENCCSQCFYCNEQFTAETIEAMKSHMVSQNCIRAREEDPRINVPLRNTENYRYEANRLVTFMNANWTYPVDPESLASSGFYWTGVADASRCIFCRLEVRGWEEGDTGEGEHRRWNPNCPFINGASVGNLRLGEEEEESSLLEDQRSSVNNNDFFPEVLPSHPEYSSIPSRLASYAMWPRSLRHRPEQLSDAGFYYTGHGDRVICFQCGGGLKDWTETDEPWVEHAVWFSRCPYVLAKKGKEFIAKQKQHAAQIADPLHIEASCFQPEIVDSKAPPMSGPAQQKLQESRSTSDSQVPATNYNNLCKVCLVKELGIVILPCGHVTTCSDCILQLTNCPLCRGRINSYVRAFLP